MRSSRHTLKESINSFMRYANLRLITLCILLSTYGCMLVYSAAYGYGSGLSGAAMQIAASAGGLIAAILISRFDYENICSLWPVWSGLTVILMILTFTPLGLNATGTDDTAWLAIGSFTFQPSELLKIAYIVSFSVHISKVQDSIREFKTLLLLGLHAIIPIALVFAQGDDGTALVFVMITITMLLVSGINLLYFVFGLAGICGVVPILWTYFLDDSKKARFLCILPPYVDKYLDSVGYQQFEALKAIGSGKLDGVGYLGGSSNPTLFARNNDLIFTVAAEEFGFIGSILLLLLLGLIIFELYRCAKRARDNLGSYLCIGMMSLIGFQSIINLGMNLRLLPVVGITLPFFSAGGSSVATLYLGVGLVLSVSYSERTRRQSLQSI